MVARFMPIKVKAKVVLNANKPVRLWRYNAIWPSLMALNAAERYRKFLPTPGKGGVLPQN